MADAGQEVYIFDEHSDEEHKEESQGSHPTEAASPTRLKPVRTLIRSARGKSSDKDPDTPPQKARADKKEMDNPHVFEFKQEDYIVRVADTEESPSRKNQQSQLISSESPEESPVAKPNNVVTEEDQMPKIQLGGKVIKEETHPVLAETRKQDSPILNLQKKRMEPQREQEPESRGRRQMEPEAENDANEADEQEEEEEEEAEGSMSSVDESEYLDQFPLPSDSVRRETGAGSLFTIKQVPSSSNVEAEAIISKEYMMQPLSPGTVLTCWVVKQKSGLLKTGSTYLVYTKADKKLVMAAKKLSAKTTSQYLISLSADNITTRDGNYFACCRSNFFGTEWNIYDSGSQPEKTRIQEQVRKQLCHIEYEFNLFGMNGPRKLDVVIPRLTKTNRASVVRSIEGQNQLKLFREQQPQKIMRLNNKQPAFDAKLKVFVLDFKGKVKEASVKNFILHDHYTKQDCLIFGKHTEQRYLMQLTYPLSPVQAFGICLTSLDRKLMVE